MTTSLDEAVRDRHRSALVSRTAASHAAFLLPHLRSGMALLDLGCGPGSITIGLAEAVAPGPAVGVDLEPGSPLACRADARELPFADGSFDAIYVGTLLQHLPDPLAALREARRVARPGAVIGLADADWGGYLLAPSTPELAGSFEVMAKMHRGSPYVGRRLRGLLVEAGFTRATATASTRHHGTPDEVRGLAAFQASWFGTAGIADTVVARGFATRAELSGYAEAWRAWGEQPGAFFAGFWCEALGWA